MKAIFTALAIAFASPWIADGEETWHPFNRQFDKKVTLQGVGWGLGAKGLGIRVVTPDGVPVYFDPKDEELRRVFSRWQGRLIEVTGTLRKRQMTPAPEGAQGYTSGFDYLVVESAKITGISKIERSLTPKAEEGSAHQSTTRPESKSE